MTEYSYDDTGVYFAYFVISVLSIILIPLSYWWVTDWAPSFASASACLCSLCKSKFLSKRTQDKHARRVSRAIKSLFLLAGWLLILYLAFIIYSTEIVLPVQWDPWTILGVSKSAGRSDVKRAYHKLAITQHPDKIKDASLKEKANAVFSDISKAYKVLSDKEAFKKFEEWGDPDGKQSFSMGIALPTALVAVHNSSLVLLVYGLIFGGLLPWRIGKWWYKTRKYTKDQILSPTMGTLFKQTHERTGINTMMINLAQATEFGDDDNVPYRGAPDDELIKSLESLMANVYASDPDSSWDPKHELANVTKPSARKALLQLAAHLFRPDAYTPNPDALRTVTKMAHILQCGLLPITLARGWLLQSLHCMDLTQLIVQGVWNSHSSILQVPHVTVEHTKVMAKRDPAILTLQAFADLSDTDRRAIFQGDNMSDDHFADMSAFMAAYPRIVLEKLDFKVIGEPSITPGALVTCIIRVRLAPISISRAQLNKEYEAKHRGKKSVLLENDSAKDDVTLVKAAVADKGKLEMADDEDEDEDDSDLDAFELEGEGDGGRGGKAASKFIKAIKYSHAPRFPVNKRPGWWVLIGNTGGNRVINAQRVSDIQDRGTIKIQFQAPGEPGVYPFSVFIKSDHWVGSDMRLDVQMKVDPMTEDRQAVLNQADDDEISDPDEDTLAGQMAVLRGQKTKQSFSNEDGDHSSSGSESSSDDD